jgi:hypothetical protein
VLTSIVVDIDDTLVNTSRRTQAVWRLVLGCEVPLEAVETLSLEQVFMKFASPEQKQRVGDFQKRFWDVSLCLDEAGLESIGLNEAIPFAANVVQEWGKHYKLVYLTGRTENARSITLSELQKLGFPIEGAELVMFSLEDFARARGLNPSGPTLADARAQRLSEICKMHSVVRAVDDYPGYFPVYRQFNIPDRIGLLRSKRYTPQDYLDRGATRVVKNWKELENDLP